MPANSFRTIQLARGAVGDDNCFELAISSEAPYERWFGIEILSHDPTAVDLSRLGDGRHPLLLNHCTDDQIGVVKSCQIDADRMLRGIAQLSRNDCGQEIKNDINDGIRSLVSVGYFIDEIVEVEPAPDNEMSDYVTEGARWKKKRVLSGDEFTREMREAHGDAWNRGGLAASRAQAAEPDTYLVTRWTPFEASIVPIPADTTVGVGRSAGAGTHDRQQPSAPEPNPLPTLETIMTEVVTKSGAELEIERRDAIIAIGENAQYAKYLKAGDVVEAIRNGWSRDKFIEYLMERMASAHTDTSATHLGLSQKEIKRYSLSRAIVAASTGKWDAAGFELECSRAVEKLTGQTAAGFLLPNDVMSRDLVVGTATSAGNLVPTEFRGDLWVDVLRNNLVASQLGVRMLYGLTGNVDIPRKATAGVIGTVTEIGSATQSDMTTAKLTLSPKRMTSYTVASLRALQQSGLALDPIIRDDLMQGVAVQIENGFINGTGTDPQMQGIRTATGIGTATAGANGGTVTWGNVVGLESACANSNAEPDRLAGYMFNTKQRGNLKQVQKGTNLPFIWDGGAQPVNGYRAAITNNLPSNLTKGTSTTVCSAALFSSDWSMAVIGLFCAPDITVDPYTKADTGEVKVTINAFADSGVRQPAAFSKIEDLL